MAQPITPAVPSFVLACIRTKRIVSVQDWSTRWQYNYDQCNKRGISVISYGADGDSCEMKAMKLLRGLFTEQKAISQSL